MNASPQCASAAALNDDCAVSFRHPEKGDGAQVWRLVNQCPPLDANSLYCNLLQCSHFADTCILAESGGEAVGWVSGYRPPGDPETLFIWQVAVHESMRGAGLGRSMIGRLIAEVIKDGVTRIRTTITKGNQPSWALFASLAKMFDAPLDDIAWLDRNRDLAGAHDTEHLVTIGPLDGVNPAHPEPARKQEE